MKSGSGRCLRRHRGPWAPTAALLCVLAVPALASAQLDVDFIGTPVSGTNPLVVSFTDTTTGDTPVLWSWSFGDGGSANMQNPLHLFAGPGTFTVRLTVFVDGGGFDGETKVDYITVAPAMLDVDFVASPTFGLSFVETSFINTTSGGPVGSWLWTFGDGQTSTQMHPTHTFDNPGTYTVSLTAIIGLQQETVVKQDFITVESAFAPPVVISGAVINAIAMHGVDLDRDGDMDLVTTSSLDMESAWFENTDGAGSFGPKNILTSPPGFPSPKDSATADLDGDAYPEVILCDSKRIAWLPNLGDPGAGTTSFGSSRTIVESTTFSYASIDVVDVDGDGDTDVLSAHSVNDTIAWYENADGAGLFAPPAVISTDEDNALRVLAADLDGDGDSDVVATSRNDFSITWYENTDGEGSFGPRRFITTSAARPEFVEAVDLDGDGDLDLVAVTPDLVWFENTDGAGSFGPAHVVDDQVTWDNVNTADFDCDGDMDVMAAGFQLAWFDNTDGLGDLQPGPQPLIDPFSGGVIYLVVADMDRDGDPDVVSSDIVLGQVKWWENIIAPSPWTNLGGGFPGLLGEPVLGAKGTLEGGAPLSLSIGPAFANTLLLVWLSFASNPLDVVGGTLYANPPSAQFLRSTDAQGEWSQSAPWPFGIPPGVDFWLQGIVQDVSVPAGLTLSNAVTATTP